MSFSLYGLLVGTGFAVFWFLFEATLKDHPSLKKNSLTAALFFIAIGSLVGARLYHLWTDWNLYQNAGFRELIAVWNGGLGIYGALVGGAIGCILWKRWYAPQLSWFSLLDALVIGLPFGQAIGRWGNYVNQEVFGLPSRLPWAIEIAEQNRPNGYEQFSHFHPLFLYESVALLSVGLFFLLLRKRFSTLFPLGTGWFLGLYLFAYGMIRFSLELLRIESAPGWIGLTIAQWVSLAITAIGLTLFSRAFRLQWKSDETAEDTPAIAPAVSARTTQRRRAGSKRRQ